MSQTTPTFDDGYSARQKNVPCAIFRGAALAGWQRAHRDIKLAQGFQDAVRVDLADKAWADLEQRIAAHTMSPTGRSMSPVRITAAMVDAALLAWYEDDDEWWGDDDAYRRMRQGEMRAALEAAYRV
jgi:hypothetical protein